MTPFEIDQGPEINQALAEFGVAFIKVGANLFNKASLKAAELFAQSFPAFGKEALDQLKQTGDWWPIVELWKRDRKLAQLHSAGMPQNAGPLANDPDAVKNSTDPLTGMVHRWCPMTAQLSLVIWEILLAAEKKSLGLPDGDADEFESSILGADAFVNTDGIKIFRGRQRTAHHADLPPGKLGVGEEQQVVRTQAALVHQEDERPLGVLPLGPRGREALIKVLGPFQRRSNLFSRIKDPRVAEMLESSMVHFGPHRGVLLWRSHNGFPIIHGELDIRPPERRGKPWAKKPLLRFYCGYMHFADFSVMEDLFPLWNRICNAYNRLVHRLAPDSFAKKKNREFACFVNSKSTQSYRVRRPGTHPNLKAAFSTDMLEKVLALMDFPESVLNKLLLCKRVLRKFARKMQEDRELHAQQGASGTV